MSPDTPPSAPAAEREDPEILDAVAVPDDAPPPPPRAPAAPAASTDIIPARHQGSTELIQAQSPDERVAKATEVATALDRVIKAQGMRTKVGDQKEINPQTGEPTGKWVPRWHVNVEGWQTLGTLLGLAVVPLEPEVVRDPITGVPEKVSYDVHEKSYYSRAQGGGLKSERRYRVEGYSYSCRVEVRKDGVLIAAATSVCSRTEQRWREADDYAVMGMAQTRATGRAIAQSARWIVTLAGYNATPAEEMPPDVVAEANASAAGGRTEGPKWTYLATPQLVQSLRKAIGFLLGVEPDHPLVNEVGRRLELQVDSKVRTIQVLAIAALAKVKLEDQQTGATPAAAPAPEQEVTGETPPPGAGLPMDDPDAWINQGVGGRPAPGSVMVELMNPGDPQACLRDWKAAGCICTNPTVAPGRDPDCPIEGHAIVL